MKGLALALGVTLAAAQTVARDERRSGAAFMSQPLRAMEADDAANPATLWALDGEALWNEPAGEGARSCASCHGEASRGMTGVAARYPAFDAANGRPIDLAGRINQCRVRRQHAPAFAPESAELLALTTALARLSRGRRIAPPDDPRLVSFRQDGEKLFSTRRGQLDLSCADCHDDNAGRSLGGAPIPQAHPTGYPVYRLEWQSVGSLQRRLRDCLAGTRSQVYPYDSPELVALELYLATRAADMPMDAPGVRP